MSSKKPLVLIVLDGFGLSAIKENNPVAMAGTPMLDELIGHYPYGVLDASGIAVGLPWGEVGNSEVGHLNLGAGLVVYQNLPRINIAIDNKSFFQNEAFVKAAEHVKKHKSKLHLLGIASTGGVHGHIDHLKALVEFAHQQKVQNVFVHAITDGRDSAPQSAGEFLKSLEKTMKKEKTGTLATLCGRYFGMDRNTAWDRTQKCYDLLTQGIGEKFRNANDALKSSYKKKIDDELFEPAVLTDRKGDPLALIADNDAVIFFNFREDRARQLANAFVEKTFDGFERKVRPKNLFFATMTEYEAGMPVSAVAFPPQYIKHPFGWLVAQKKLKQLRIAETEKYAHVTYFFNGGQEAIYENEDRMLIPSPRVKTYDEKPEMSAYEVAKKLCAEIAKKKYDFCLVNFANADMVGHTGNLKATVRAIKAVDECVGQVVEANRKIGGITAITADHGNAENKIDPLKHTPVKEHSTSAVPFILVSEDMKRDRSSEEVEVIKGQVNPIGILADVAPTLLELIGITPDSEMTGRSLLKDLL